MWNIKKRILIYKSTNYVKINPYNCKTIWINLILNKKNCIENIYSKYIKILIQRPYDITNIS